MSERSDIPALEARELTLSWDGGQSIVVEDVDLYVNAGEIVCLVGKSGCGKTTILHALSGLSAPLRGEVLLHGTSIAAEPGHVSYMLQKDLLLPHLRIRDNVCLPLTLAGTPKDEALKKAGPLFERFGLKGTEDQWPSQLSGGMRQRAAFMRTYLMGNDVVLLDEPFSALDTITKSQIHEWYLDIMEEINLTTVFITHDIDEAILLSDRIYIMAGRPGRIDGEVRIEPARRERDGFNLTPEFLAYKRQIVEMIGM